MFLLRTGTISMNGFELCENSDQQKLPPMLMKSGLGKINLSMCTVALRNKVEESVRKRKQDVRTQTRMRRVESRTTTT